MDPGNNWYRNPQIDALLEAVESVTIYEGRIRDDPKLWEICFKGLNTPLKIDSEQLDSAGPFRRKFLKLTDTPAPPLKASDWFAFIAGLSERAEHKKSLEESDNVYIAETVMEAIRAQNIIKLESATTHKGYVPIDGYRCVHHHTVKELTEGLGFKFTGRILSDTLTQLGYKEEGTKQIRVKGLKNPVRFWRFPEAVFVFDCESESNA